MNSAKKIKFSPLIIGTMRLGVWGEKLNKKQLESFIDQCLELDLKDFDHAYIYGCYTTESHFGAVLKSRKDLQQKVQITTKCGIKLICKERPNHKIKSYDSSAAHIITSAENSLKELGIERIDVLLLHRPDYLMHPQEVATAFEQLRQQGKVKHFGVSNFTPSQFDLLHSITPLVTNQIEASILHRSPFEDGTLDQCLKWDITPTAWSPLGGGAIFSKATDAKVIGIQKIAKELGEKYNAGMDQILLAWLNKHPSGIIPVLGTSKIARVQTSLAALQISLTQEEWYELWQAAIGEEVA